MFDLVPFRKESTLPKRIDYVNQLFDNFFNDDFFAPFQNGRTALRADLQETASEYVAEVDLPGIEKEDIQLTYTNNYLTISANREETQAADGQNYLRRERRYGSFQRSFYVTNVDESNIKAAFRNGVLRITLPKLQPEPPATKQIPID